MPYTYKLLMPGDHAANPFIVPGSKIQYTCAAGATISVPDFHAALMINCGWINSIGPDVGSGTTAQRPLSPPVGGTFNDSTVGAAVTYGGPRSGWLHHATGVTS